MATAMGGREIDLTGYFRYAEPMEKEMTFNEWIEQGIKQGYCSEIVCCTHDGPPISETEDQLIGEGHDPCCFIVRLGSEADWEKDAQAYSEIAND